jgi:hypothetical protein
MTRPRRFAEQDPRPSSKGLRECRWPIGHPGEAGFRFCGAKTQVGSVYCDQHAEIAFTKPSGRTVIGRSTKRR